MADQEHIPQARETVLRQTLLQAIMKEQVMPETDAKELYRQIYNTQDDSMYTEIIADINTDLGFAQFELRTIKYPGNNERYIGFVNIVADEESKRSGRFKTKEGKPDIRLTTFFKTLIEKIATNEDAEDGIGFIKSRDAFSLLLMGPSDTGAEGEETVIQLGASAREQALNQLVADGWLDHHLGHNDAYCLGVRSYLELGRMILEMDLPEKNREALEPLLA